MSKYEVSGHKRKNMKFYFGALSSIEDCVPQNNRLYGILTCSYSIASHFCK